MRPPREFSLGFGTIKSSLWRCSDLLKDVSPVFDRTESIIGEIFSRTPAFQRSLGKFVPLVSSLSSLVPSRHLPDAVAIYNQRSLQYSILQKLLLGTYFPHMPAIQRSLWKCVPPMTSPPGSVRSRHRFGAVAIYYRRSLQYSILQKLLSWRSIFLIRQSFIGVSGNASPP